MFIRAKTGVVVYSENKTRTVGTFLGHDPDEYWTEEKFTPFYGEIKLSKVKKVSISILLSM